MSKEVTTKRLRDYICAQFNGLIYGIQISGTSNKQQSIASYTKMRDDYLSVFDEMAEKAEKGELFEKLEKLREQHYYTAIHLKHERVEIRSRDAKYKLAVKSDALTLAEALKAVRGE